MYQRIIQKTCLEILLDVSLTKISEGLLKIILQDCSNVSLVHIIRYPFNIALEILQTIFPEISLKDSFRMSFTGWLKNSSIHFLRNSPGVSSKILLVIYLESIPWNIWEILPGKKHSRDFLTKSFRSRFVHKLRTEKLRTFL